MPEPVVAAALIFVLRCLDVSLGTLRLILTVQGRRLLSALIGFFEVSVFITAVATVVQGPLDPLRVLGYGAGFAAGTYLGMTIDRWIGLGDVIVRVISTSCDSMVKGLTASGFGVTFVEAHGGRGTEVGVVFSMSHRRRTQEMLALIRAHDPDAIVTVQEVRQQYHGYFTPKRPGLAPLGPIRR